MSKKIVLETPIGVRDYGPDEMSKRSLMLSKIRNIFELYNAIELDTSIFEFTNILQYKYGEDEKLIFNLKDDKISLRYDLTVPLVRYLIMNKIEKGKFFRIGKVYRCDTPIISKGRLREFYQCDLDIIGNFDLMFTDAECISIIYDILLSLGISKFTIRINNRKIIDSIFKLCNVPKKLFSTITSSVDKLDKHDWTYIRNEMIQKGLDDNIINSLENFFNKAINLNDLEDLLKSKNGNIVGIDEIKRLIDYLHTYEINSFIFDISLVRGLDYYTGTIFEVIVPSEDIGSIAAGGRYDKLINSYNNTMNIPCVGMSIGFERIFLLSNIKNEDKCKAYIVTCGNIDVSIKINLIKQLRSENIKCDMSYKKKAKVLDQFQYAEDNNIPYCIILGEDEINRQVYKIKNTQTREECEIPFNEIIEFLKNA